LACTLGSLYVALNEPLIWPRSLSLAALVERAPATRMGGDAAARVPQEAAVADLIAGGAHDLAVVVDTARCGLHRGAGDLDGGVAAPLQQEPGRQAPRPGLGALPGQRGGLSPIEAGAAAPAVATVSAVTTTAPARARRRRPRRRMCIVDAMVVSS
jgi:hypothetical protein